MMKKIKKISISLLVLGGALLSPMITQALYDIYCDKCVPKLHTTCICKTAELRKGGTFTFSLKPDETTRVRAHCTAKIPPKSGVQTVQVTIDENKNNWSVHCPGNQANKHVTDSCTNYNAQYTHTVKIRKVSCTYI